MGPICPLQSGDRVFASATNPLFRGRQQPEPPILLLGFPRRLHLVSPYRGTTCVLSLRRPRATAVLLRGGTRTEIYNPQRIPDKRGSIKRRANNRKLYNVFQTLKPRVGFSRPPLPLTDGTPDPHAEIGGKNHAKRNNTTRSAGKLEQHFPIQ